MIELIQKSDAITVHVPLPLIQKNLINLDVNEKIENTAILNQMLLVGGIVNEEDLYTALSQNEIAGAGFDVFTEEPPKADEKLLTLDNFLLTPHTASKTKEADNNTIQASVRNILADLEG